MTMLVPLLVPELDAVRALADELHARGEAWQGEAFGWSAEYNPEQQQPPLDSALTFTPADFCIGESGIWFYSLMWERGCDEPPVEFVDERNLAADES
jgi:hypothetical protein